MSRIKELHQKFVEPGDEIGVIEEFIPGVGTYVDSLGVIRASLPGYVLVDMMSRQVVVRQATKVPRIPKKGECVYGVVVNVRDELAIVHLISDCQGSRYSSEFTGLLHISQAADKYLKDIHEAVGLGDIIKARVTSDKLPYGLSLREGRNGVVIAFCSKCGSALKKLSGEVLACPKCGNREKRKVSPDYGNLKL